MKKNSQANQRNITNVAIIGTIIVFAILIMGTVWMGRSGRTDTERAVRAVSLLYLDELAGRREQVVESNLQNKIRDLQTAVDLLDENDLTDISSLQEYQAKMRQLYNVDKFAFVDADGLIYTANGTLQNISDYAFDYTSLDAAEISILNLQSEEKKVVVAAPVDIHIDETVLKVCFMEIDMQEMLQGVSMNSDRGASTFCNLYTKDGIALTNTILGGLAVEDNLLVAMQNAVFEDGYSYEEFKNDFQNDARGEVSFIYNGIRETLSYIPVRGTDWQLTYLIRESVISDQISSISGGIIIKSIIQSILTIIALLAMFLFIISQSRRNAQLRLEQETAEAANKVKQEEMEQRLMLQQKLLDEEKHRTQLDKMITAMATDYRSVYHVDLAEDVAVCYRADPNDKEQFKEGEYFPYQESFIRYAERFVAEQFRDGFLDFVNPESIRKRLEKEEILAYRYLVQRDGNEYYEMIRIADALGRSNDPQERTVNEIGLGLTIIDTEMRETLAREKVLSEALAEAEQANKAKTTFLSSMSHEIRTPMNAIIGLDNIALNDPETPEKIKGYLEKIGTSADHLLNIINDILDMSRIESGRMTLKNEEFSFRKLLESINTLFAGQTAEKGIDYQCHVLGELDDYYIGDSMKLRQVLINILSNAVKFTPEGGKVEFSVAKKAGFEGKTALCFTVADTGIGMSPEFLPHIFDTFSQENASTTNKHGSSGLGMSITKNIVEMMNGNIEVESEKGKGSTFTVTVTLADSARKDSAEDAEEIRPEDMTVLIVDDDPIACEHARLVLGKAGINSETAASGAEAVEKVRLRHARRVPYNLILIDWKMPEMDGVEATRKIREIVGHESAIIILTAYRWDDILEEATQAGVDSFLAKPLFAGAVMDEFRSASKRKCSKKKGGEKKADLTGRRILLAEDVQINAEIMMMVLENRKMQVDLAENGRIAVDKFAAHEPGYYDAVLMDMRMPEMDGLTATKTIRAMDREDAKTIPIIALTANAFDEDVQRSLQAGLNAHLSKPVQPDSLYETLESLLRT